MYIRRRNYEHGRIKRSNRKSKTFEAFNNIFGTYFKLLLIWAAILMLDFFTDFRFEFLYSCWLFIRTVVDSFRYQGLAFALFFTLIALTSDLICYFLVPTALIYLLGSSFVWVQLIWQADRGVYGPTMVFCFLFVYVEVAVRLRDPKTLPLSVDLCRPFAAHCIGYPAVTLGFGLKTMVAHHLRSRRQQSVEAQNRTFFALLEEALPKEFRYYFKSDAVPKSKRCSPVNPNSSCPALTGSSVTSSHRTNSMASGPSDKCHAMVSNPNPSNRKHTHNTNNNSSSIANQVISSSMIKLDADCPDSSVHFQESSTCPCGSASRSGASLLGSNPDFLQRESDALENDRLSELPPSSTDNTCSSSWLIAAPDILDDAYASEFNNSRSVMSHGGSARDIKAASNHSKPATCASSGSTASVASTSSSLSSISSSLNHLIPNSGPSCSTRPTSNADLRNSSINSKPVGGTGGNTVTITNSTSKSNATSANPTGGNSNHGKSNSGGCKPQQKDEYTLKLEAELRRLKTELQSLRASEIDLRTQVQQLTTAERTYRSESAQAHQESESLQAKLQQLTQRLQADHASLQTAEKRLAEERKQRTTLEQQIATQQQQQSRSVDKSRKDAQDESASLQSSGASAPSANKNQTSFVSRGTSTFSGTVNASSSFVGACLGGDSCANRIEELEAELRALTRDLSDKELQLAALKDSRASSLSVNGNGTVMTSGSQKIHGGFKSSESTKSTMVESGHPPRRTHPDSVTVCKANKELLTRLNSLQEENQRLTDTLKEEDKMKQELMTAYHSSLKEITELNATLTKKEYQIVELIMRLEHLTPPLYDYMHMLNGPISAESSVASTNPGKPYRAQPPTLWPNNLTSATGGGENMYTASSQLSAKSTPIPHRPATAEDLRGSDPRSTHLISNGGGQSQQTSGQNSYASNALDAALRGLCQVASGRTVSTTDYASSRLNNVINIQTLNTPGVQPRVDSNTCYSAQQTSSQPRSSRTSSTTANTPQFDMVAIMPTSAQHQQFYQSVTSSNPTQLARCKSSSGTANRMQSPCPYSLSGGRPLPVGRSAPPTSPPPFMASPPGLFNISNTIPNGIINSSPVSSGNNNLHSNGPFHQSSSTSNPMAPLDLQPLFVSTPLDAVVQSDSHLQSGLLHSPTNVELLQHSPSGNPTSLACLMNSLSPMNSSNPGSHFFGLNAANEARERSLSHVLNDVTTSSGAVLLGPLSDSSRRMQSTVTSASQGFNASSAFDASELSSVNASGSNFLTIDGHPTASPFEHSINSQSESRATSLDIETECSTHLVNMLESNLISDTKSKPS